MKFRQFRATVAMALLLPIMAAPSAFGFGVKDERVIPLAEEFSPPSPNNSINPSPEFKKKVGTLAGITGALMYLAGRHFGQVADRGLTETLNRIIAVASELQAEGVPITNIVIHQLKTQYGLANAEGFAATCSRLRMTGAILAVGGTAVAIVGTIFASTGQAQGGELAPSIPMEYYAASGDIERYRLGADDRLFNLYELLKLNLSNEDLQKEDLQLAQQYKAGNVSPDYFVRRQYINHILKRYRQDEYGNWFDREDQERELAEQYAECERSGAIERLHSVANLRLDQMRVAYPEKLKNLVLVEPISIQ